MSEIDPKSFSILGYPKVGNTWLHHVIVKAFDLGWDDVYHTHGMEDEDFNTKKFDEEIIFNFGGHFFRDKLIVLTRHLGDVLASLYMHNRFREDPPRFFGQLDDIVLDPVYGADKYLMLHNIVDSVIRVSSIDLMIIKYEDLLDDESIFLNILDFIGQADRDDAVAAIEESRFEVMKENERNGLYIIPTLSRAINWETTDNGFKVREGRSGIYVDKFSKENIEIIDEYMKQMPAIFGYNMEELREKNAQKETYE